jgi:predicted nucleic-acid-binding Zn-ribbon protein
VIITIPKLKNLTMSGTGISRLLADQLYHDDFASCSQCSFTEINNLGMLQGEDDLGIILWDLPIRHGILIIRLQRALNQPSPSEKIDAPEVDHALKN